MRGTMNSSSSGWTGVYTEKQIEQTSDGPVVVQALYHNICKEPTWSTHSQEEHRLMDYEAMGRFRYQSKGSRDVLRGAVTAEFYPRSSNTPDSGSYRQTLDQSGGHQTFNQPRGWSSPMAYQAHSASTLPIEYMSLEDMGPNAVATQQEQLQQTRLELSRQKHKNYMSNDKAREEMWKQMDIVTKQRYEREVEMARAAGKRNAFGELADAMGLDLSLYQPVNLTTVKEKLEEKIQGAKFNMSDAEARKFAASNPIVRGIIVANVKKQVDLEMDRIRAAEFDTKLKIG